MREPIPSNGIFVPQSHHSNEISNDDTQTERERERDIDSTQPT